MIDISIPVENPKLKDAMRDALLTYTDKTNTDFREELKKSNLLAPTIVSESFNKEKGNTFVLQKDEKISFLLSKNKEGDCLFPVFTDWEELFKWTGNKDTNAFVLTLEDYHTMMNQPEAEMIGIAINPASEGLLLTKEQIAFILGKSIPMTIKKETKIILGEPKEYPVKMVNAIINFCKKKRTIHRIWIKQMMQGEEISHLLIVDFEKEEQAKLFDEIATVAQPYLNGIYLDMILYKSELGQKAARNTDPFYQKKRFSFFGR